jgi:hypothetical protein
MVAYGIGISTCPPAHPPWLPRLCLVSEAMRIDVGLFLIRNTIFELESSLAALEYLEAFLETFPGEQGFASVLRLCFSELRCVCPSAVDYRKFLEIVKRCRGITEL